LSIRAVLKVCCAFHSHQIHATFVLVPFDDDQNTPCQLDTCDAFSDVNTIKSITNAAVDIPEHVTSICDRFYEQYFADGCGCVRMCHEVFPREVAFQAHLDALELDQYCPSHVNHQHLLLLGA